MEETDEYSHADGSSLYLYAAMIQRRIPRIRSTIKRALSQDHRTIHRNQLPTHNSVDSCSPPPSYRSEDTDTGGHRLDTHSFESDMDSSRPSSSGSSTPARQDETASGVRWRFAVPGFQVLRLAETEAAAPTANTSFVRSQYINGTACILRGLPADLTPAEALSLREAIADLPASQHLQDRQMVPHSRHSTSQSRRSAALQQQSVLHRGVAFATLHVFLVVTFLLPYIHMLLQQVYQFDRRHRISERVLAHSVTTADRMGRRTVTIAAQVCAMNDGRVGELMKEMGMYLVQGFGGGIYDGIGESLSAIGLRAADGAMYGEAPNLRSRPQSSAF